MRTQRWHVFALIGRDVTEAKHNDSGAWCAFQDVLILEDKIDRMNEMLGDALSACTKATRKWYELEQKALVLEDAKNKEASGMVFWHNQALDFSSNSVKANNRLSRIEKEIEGSLPICFDEAGARRMAQRLHNICAILADKPIIDDLSDIGPAKKC